MLLEKADASQIVLGPPRGLEQLSERPDWQRVAAVVIVDHDPAPVGMAIHSLPAFRAPIHKAIVLQSPSPDLLTYASREMSGFRGLAVGARAARVWPGGPGRRVQSVVADGWRSAA